MLLNGVFFYALVSDGVSTGRNDFWKSVCTGVHLTAERWIKLKTRIKKHNYI